ncbi:Arginase, catabolizes arginine to ornithine and urea [Mycoemilia scoparia]|uniref:Arginase n=1 Tax=Mycoemilia scoparia TaxID=417184 RepID=A0A9W7ZZP1_9FUNG|nr:Arginase, catabolizes arginine to ornithine and urea [Mycoemilia scoparia]
MSPTLHKPHGDPSFKNKFISEPHTVGVVTVPFSGGQPKGGVDAGPIELLRFGILDQIKGLGYKVDFSDGVDQYSSLKPKSDPDVGKMKKPRFVSSACEKVKGQVEGHCKQGSLALTLGGDHSIAMGTISGSAAKYGDQLRVIWVDAHADINTPESTESGNLHGCPLSFITGIAKNVAPFEWLTPCLKPEHLVYIGLRDVDAGEKKILREHGIRAYSMHEVDKYGISKVVEMALEYLSPSNDNPIHLSFDVDALDPSVAPSTGTPVRGGLTFREGHYICEAIHETGCLVAMDLVEVNPLLGDQTNLYQTVTVGCSLVRCALGETLL